jgi:hypothetical protein
MGDKYNKIYTKIYKNREKGGLYGRIEENGR